MSTMKPRQLTLSAIGLPVRTELRIKSLLQIVNSRTLDRWSFSDGTAADIVICEPTSALSVAVLKRAKSHGSPRCVSLIKDGILALPNTEIIRDPILSAEFIILLNAVSSSIVAQRNDRVPRKKDSLVAESNTDPFHFAYVLRTLLRDSGQHAFRIEDGSYTFHVHPATRQISMERALGSADFFELLNPRNVVTVSQLPDARDIRSIEAGAVKQNADWMLWCLGLHGPQDRCLPELSEGSELKLRRWPDFGRLQPATVHLRLAARLSRKEQTMTELAASVDQPIDIVRPFINACTLCDLLTIHGAPAAIAAEVVSTVTGRSELKRPAFIGHGSILHTIRTALGFGAS